MNMPTVSMTVMTPSGRTIKFTMNPQTKWISIEGMENGPMSVRIEEAFAIKQILGIVIE